MSDRRPVTRRRTAVVLIAAALVLGACSSGGDDEADPATTTSSSTTAAPGTDTTEPGSGTTEPGTGTTEPARPPVGRDGFVDATAAAIDDSMEVGDDAVSRCIAEGWVDGIGYDRIADADVLPDDFGSGTTDGWEPLEVADDEADALLAVMAGCGFDVAPTIRAGVAFGEDAEVQACIEAALDDEAVARFMTKTFTADPSVTADIEALMASCGVDGDE